MTAYERRRSSSDRSPTPWIVGGLLLVLAAGAAWWFWLRPGGNGDGGTDRRTARDTAADTAAMTRDRADLPELDASDELVRRLAAELSSRPRLAEWLATDELIRRFVSAVVRISAGRSPREPLDFMEPEGPFRVRGESGDTTVVDTAAIASDSYRRYDAAAATFASLDTEGTAELYRRLHPLFVDAYHELGFREPSFDRTMARAVQMLLAVPVPDGTVEVVPTGGTDWQYADPALEGLAPAQKQLLRMGPDNIRRVQAKLRELERAIGLPAPPREGGG